MSYHWETCPDVVRQQVTTFVEGCAPIIGSNLVGIYLHGSLAMGCFNPARSDLDLLVVSEALLTAVDRRQLVERLLSMSGQPIPIEISFLARSQLHPWQHPTPFDLHFSEDWRDKMQQQIEHGSWQNWQPSVDGDLAGHVTVTRARGICLVGTAIADVFPQVPHRDYLDSILRDVVPSLDTIEENPVYVILNTCRTLAYLQQGKIYSKDEGGIWGLSHLDGAIQPVIEQALFQYRHPQPLTLQSISTSQLRQFVATVHPLLLA